MTIDYRINPLFSKLIEFLINHEDYVPWPKSKWTGNCVNQLPMFSISKDRFIIINNALELIPTKKINQFYKQERIKLASFIKNQWLFIKYEMIQTKEHKKRQLQYTPSFDHYKHVDVEFVVKTFDKEKFYQSQIEHLAVELQSVLSENYNYQQWSIKRCEQYLTTEYANLKAAYTFLVNGEFDSQRHRFYLEYQANQVNIQHLIQECDQLESTLAMKRTEVDEMIGNQNKILACINKDPIKEIIIDDSSEISSSEHVIIDTCFNNGVRQKNIKKLIEEFTSADQLDEYNQVVEKYIIDRSSSVTDTEEIKMELMKQLFFFPGKNGVPVRVIDYFCLNKGCYLNDIIIDFYLNLIHGTILTSEQQQKILVYSTHFYTTISHVFKNGESRMRMRHDFLSSWMKERVFDKDFLIIPINDNVHWLLAIVCFPAQVIQNIRQDESDRRPQIIMLNSMGPKNKSNYCRLIRCLLNYAYIQENKNSEENGEDLFTTVTLPERSLIVPIQNNMTDCGLHVLQYVEIFFKQIVSNELKSIHHLSICFEQSVITEKREKISNIIICLTKKTNTETLNLPILEFPTNENLEVGNKKHKVDDSVRVQQFLHNVYEIKNLIHRIHVALDDGFVNNDEDVQSLKTKLQDWNCQLTTLDDKIHQIRKSDFLFIQSHPNNTEHIYTQQREEIFDEQKKLIAKAMSRKQEIIDVIEFLSSHKIVMDLYTTLEAINDYKELKKKIKAGSQTVEKCISTGQRILQKNNCPKIISDKVLSVIQSGKYIEQKEFLLNLQLFPNTV